MSKVTRKQYSTYIGSGVSLGSLKAIEEATASKGYKRSQINRDGVCVAYTIDDNEYFIDKGV